MEHIRERHMRRDLFSEKSKFLSCNLAGLLIFTTIRFPDEKGVSPQVSVDPITGVKTRRKTFVKNFHRTIGFNGSSRLTSLKVVQEENGDLVTAFPCQETTLYKIPDGNFDDSIGEW